MLHFVWAWIVWMKFLLHLVLTDLYPNISDELSSFIFGGFKDSIAALSLSLSLIISSLRLGYFLPSML